MDMVYGLSTTKDTNLSIMYKNILKVVFRNLWRHKSYTIINIAGMAIGIAAMVWGYQTYKFSFSFDNFHKDRDHVYRALIINKDREGLQGIFPAAAVQMAKNDLSGIKDAVRLTSDRLDVRYDKNETFSEQVYFTDPSFFTVFNFPLLAGSNDITDRNAVLITEKIAKRYFGSADPIGKVLSFYAGENNLQLTVKGVLKDVPLNSTIHAEIISHYENELTDDGKKIAADDWRPFVDAAFFSIPNPADVARVEKGLDKYLPLQNKARDDRKIASFKLISIRQNASMRDVIAANSLYERPQSSAAIGPLCLAILIFLSACLNFSNTTVANANKRLKEIGMRKVMGSTHRQLIWQLLLECAIIVLASIFISVVLNNWWIPTFNQMFVGINVSANYFHDTGLLLFIGCLFVGATLLAGAYPAFYMSRFNPTAIFRGTVKFGGSNLYSRLMLGLQLTIAIITVITGIAFSNNTAFQRDYDFGYSIDNTIGVTLGDSTSYNALKNELSTIPQITALAGSRHHIGFANRNVVAEIEGIKKQIDYLEVGKEYPAAMQLKIVAGRGFNPELESDYANALLVTQRLAAQNGWSGQQALGKRIHIDSVDYSVVGVLKDFQSESLFRPLEPVAVKLGKERRFRFLIVQAKPKDLTDVYAKVNDAWKRLFPLKPFNAFYQNNIKAEAYHVTDSIATIFFWFAMVSILLTATGLFALVSLTALKKKKEIALRRIVGADPKHILVLINKGYFWIFIVSAVLGCYSGLALARLLLDNIFKVNAGVQSGSLIGAVSMLFAITAFTSGIKVWHAIRTNPVNSLRTE